MWSMEIEMTPKREKCIEQSQQHPRTPKFKRNRMLRDRSFPKFSTLKLCTLKIFQFTVCRLLYFFLSNKDLIAHAGESTTALNIHEDDFHKCWMGAKWIKMHRAAISSPPLLPPFLSPPPSSPKSMLLSIGKL